MSALDQYKEVKVLVAIPSHHMWHPKMGMCLVSMVSEFMRVPLGKFKRQAVIPMNIDGSILANKRVDAVKKALELECSHLLFVDADQTFPKTTLHRMISHDKEVVAANIAVKRIPSLPTARGFSKDGNWRDAPLIFTDEGDNKLEKAGRIGCGLILIECKVFKETGLNIFSQPWVEAEQKYQGEDWSMCEAIQKAGFDIWIDHGLSNVVGHIGDFEFTHDVVGVVEEKPQLQVVSG